MSMPCQESRIQRQESRIQPQYWDSIVRGLKEGYEYIALAKFFENVTCVFGIITLGAFFRESLLLRLPKSLLLYGTHITVLSGLTTTLAMLAQSYFAQQALSTLSTVQVAAELRQAAAQEEAERFAQQKALSTLLTASALLTARAAAEPATRRVENPPKEAGS